MSDPLSMMTVAIVLLGIVLVVLAVMLIQFMRAQQLKSRRQAARRAVEKERGRLRVLRVRAEQQSPGQDKGERPAKGSGRGSSKQAALQVELANRELELEERFRGERKELQARQAALVEREDLLLERQGRTSAEARTVKERQEHLDQELARLETQTAQLAAAEAEQRDALAAIAGLSADEARAELLAQVEREARLHATQMTREIEAEARKNGEQQAREIIVGAIQRLASEQTTESVVSTVALPSDEMKGRIIGREGRNIRAFEQVTGVNVMIDDTPESVLLSCFDPVRREVGRLTLTELIQDGRIHPARIEEVHERSQRRIEALCQRAAEDAVTEMGITDLNPGLMPVLGSLKYRTSYGQNVLKHLVECGHLAAMMAAELGLDVDTCRRAAFLHDIGKALTHEVEGSHAAIGADLARRHGEHPDIVHAIEAHHNEVEPRTVEALLTQAADAISGGRPGARRESLEVYVKRLERLEEIARSHEGVDKVFAMQAGREVRVMVAPEQVNDNEAQAIARDIARQVEGELTYPGNIRVTVVRESRAVELAR